MMDVQMAPPPYTAAGSFTPPVGKPPVLGSQIPGTTGGLPAPAGLSATASPMANQLQSMGRDEDTMLVHMTPGEVNSLQGLAMAHGGSLTINPQTGLPEAGFLKKLLPTLLGAGLMFIPGVNAITAAGIVGAGSVLKTGSLKKGLLAGLSAYGGASLAGGLGAGTVFKKAAEQTVSAGAGAAGATRDAVTFGSQAGAPTGLKIASFAPGASGTGLTTAVNTAGQAAGQAAAKTGLAGVAQRFGQEAARGLPGGMIGKAAPMLAASGLMQGVSNAMTPSMGNMGSDGVIDNSYAGPYTEQVRSVSYPGQSPIVSGDSSEHLYFSNSMPEIYNMQGQVVQPGSSTARGTPILQNILNPNAKKGQNRYTQTFVPYGGAVSPEEEEAEGYADGGEVDMENGSFVVDARTVSELGNGSSNAGMEFLSRMGGQPLQGPGDGVSDSIRASIGGKQEARVARDEVLFPPEAVKRLGGGSANKGTDKLYSLMNKAHKARKKAKRGQDTNLRSGLV